MKNLWISFLLIFLLVFLSSCFSEQNDEANKAKQELLSGSVEENSDWENSSGDLENQNTSNSWSFLDNKDKYNKAEETEVKKEKYSVEYLTDKRFISLDSLEWKDLASLKVELTWKTLIDSVDKIIVKFSNDESNFPDDNYTLQTFEAWDDSFLYRAFDSFETLDYGVNEYTIEAHSWTDISKLKVVLNVFEDEEDYLVENEMSTEKENNVEKINMDDLPENSDFGSPTEIKEGLFTYTDIKWLELKNIWVNWPTLDSDSVTSFLTDNISWWFYWNSLRPILWDRWVSFYVIRLEDDKYFYEKHYYLSNGLYWTILLDTWTWFDLDSLSDKNQEFSEKNDNFVITNITDKLFINILNQ